MKTKIVKQAALWTTLIFATLIGIVISSGKALASKPKIQRSKKRSNTTKVIKHKSSITSAIESHFGESSAMRSILSSTTGLKPNVLRLGLNAYKWAENHADVKKKYLTIVDYSIPSKDKRMWVINLNTDKVVLNTLVANGKGSGLYKGVKFSNKPGSLESSLGVYVTGAKYYGSDGLSMHVHGLQSGINSNAYSRAIEFHGAWYVSPTFAKEHGRVGRSWGCFALNKAIVSKVVNTIDDGSVVFAYATGNSQDYTPYAA